DGDVDEEDPLPAEPVDDRTADQPSGGCADAAERAPDPERLVPLGSLLEGGGDDRERTRGHDRGPDPLEGTRPNQRLIRPGEPTEKRGEREEDEADHEHSAAPEQIGRPAAEQEQAGKGERVGADHPLQPLGRETEIVLDRGQRDRHDRRIEDDHEEGAAEQRQRPPAAGIGLGWGVGILQLLGHLDFLSDWLLRRGSWSRDVRGKRFGWRRMQARVLGRRRTARSWSSALVIGPPSVPATSGAEWTALLERAFDLRCARGFRPVTAATLLAREYQLRRPARVVVDGGGASSLG